LLRRNLYTEVYHPRNMAFETNSVESILLIGGIGLLMLLTGVLTFVGNTMTLSDIESTEGTVIGTGVGESRGTEPGSPSTYYPVIKYEYTVNGGTYTNSNYRLGSGRPTMSSFRAEEITTSYREAGEVTVYYEASDPSNSFIKKDRPAHPYALMIFGLILLMISVKMLTPYLDRE